MSKWGGALSHWSVWCGEMAEAELCLAETYLTWADVAGDGSTDSIAARGVGIHTCSSVADSGVVSGRVVYSEVSWWIRADFPEGWLTYISVEAEVSVGCDWTVSGLWSSLAVEGSVSSLLTWSDVVVVECPWYG